MIGMNPLMRGNVLWCSLFLFVDIKKCFDSVNHAVLLKKLALNGIRGPELLYLWMTFPTIYVLGPAIYLLIIVLFIQLVDRSWKRNAPYSHPFMMLVRGLIITICQPIIKNAICMLMAIEGNPNRTARCRPPRTLVFNSMTSCSRRHMLKSYAGIFLRNLPFYAYYVNQWTIITLPTVYRMNTTLFWLCRFFLTFMLRAHQRLNL